ncbi:MAG TPA: mechanosensitive ion channel domain-containing protein [Rectinemataceae bacterium]|nr:mechanosensitive ion channel domain-containing protein [Rectinemataceae bacterium]
MDVGIPHGTDLTTPTGAAALGAGGFFERVAAFFSQSFAALAADSLLFAIVLTAATLAAATLLLLAVRAMFRRLDRALRERTRWPVIHIRSLRIVDAEQLREALRIALSYLRILAISAIAWIAVHLLALIIAPSSAGQVFALARGLWLSLVAVLAWFVAVRAFRAIESSILAVIESRSESFQALSIKSFTVLSAPMIKRAILLGIRIIGWALLILSIVMLAALVLGFFRFTWSWSQAMFGFVSGLLGPILSAIIAYIPKFLFAVVIIVIARIVLRLLKAFFSEVEAGRLGLARFDKDWARTTYKLLRLAVIVFAFIMVFPYIPGSGSEAFRSVAILLGVLLSLGSSSFVGNLMAGIALTYMSPFRIGDRVQIGNTFGDVVEKTLLVTRVQTIKNVIVTIPNALVLSREVDNFSSGRPETPLILHTSVTIGYEVPWRDVHAALLAAAARVRGLLSEPKPFVLQIALDDYSVKYEINASTADPAHMVQTYSDLHQAIQDSFAEASIEILTPAYTSLRDGSASTIPGGDRGADRSGAE